MLNEVTTSAENVLLRNVRVLDVKAGTLGACVNVLTSKGTLVDIDVKSGPHGCGEIDGGGHTLMPGMINCHAHILSPYLSEQKGVLSAGPWMLRQMKRNFEACVAAGVVCVCDMLSPMKQMNMQRRKIASGKLIGPRILASGSLLSCRGGYPPFINPMYFPISAIIGQPKLNVHTKEKAFQAVRWLKAQGADHIKVGYTSMNHDMDGRKPMPVISHEAFDAVCQAAREVGLRVSVHHNWTEDVESILQHDVASLEHIVFDTVISDALVDVIKKKGVRVVPTLTITDSMARLEEKLNFLKSERAVEMFEKPALDHLRYLSSTWLDFKGESYQESFGMWRGARKHQGYCQESAKKLHRAGVPLLAGTDLGAVLAWPGELADEIKRLHFLAGMTPIEAIRSATLDAARFVGEEKNLGSVEPGKSADVVLVEGNPLEDLDALRRPRLVGRAGRWFRPKHNELPDFWQGHSVLYNG